LVVVIDDGGGDGAGIARRFIPSNQEMMAQNVSVIWI